MLTSALRVTAINSNFQAWIGAVCHWGDPNPSGEQWSPERVVDNARAIGICFEDKVTA